MATFYCLKDNLWTIKKLPHIYQIAIASLSTTTSHLSNNQISTFPTSFLSDTQTTGTSTGNSINTSNNNNHCMNLYLCPKQYTDVNTYIITLRDKFKSMKNNDKYILEHGFLYEEFIAVLYTSLAVVNYRYRHLHTIRKQIKERRNILMKKNNTSNNNNSNNMNKLINHLSDDASISSSTNSITNGDDDNSESNHLLHNNHNNSSSNNNSSSQQQTSPNSRSYFGNSNNTNQIDSDDDSDDDDAIIIANHTNTTNNSHDFDITSPGNTSKKRSNSHNSTTATSTNNTTNTATTIPIEHNLIAQENKLKIYEKIWILLSCLDLKIGQNMGPAYNQGYDVFRAWICNVLVWHDICFDQQNIPTKPPPTTTNNNNTTTNNTNGNSANNVNINIHDYSQVPKTTTIQICIDECQHILNNNNSNIGSYDKGAILFIIDGLQFIHELMTLCKCNFENMSSELKNANTMKCNNHISTTTTTNSHSNSTSTSNTNISDVTNTTASYYHHNDIEISSHTYINNNVNIGKTITFHTGHGGWPSEYELQIIKQEIKLANFDITI